MTGFRVLADRSTRALRLGSVSTAPQAPQPKPSHHHIWSARLRPPTRLIAAFSDEVIVQDLPALPAERRAEVVAFAGRRIEGLPSPMRLGVGVVAIVVGAAGRLIGLSRVVRLLAKRPLPVVGDYVRLVRSLGYAYVWETWPATGPDGSSIG